GGGAPWATRPGGVGARPGAGRAGLAGVVGGNGWRWSGRGRRRGRGCDLARQVSPPSGATVASLAGVQATLEALARIEAGSSAPEDFECVGDRWDIRQRLHHALERDGLGHLDAATPASSLSGGEAMRVALASAMLSEADFLILDEPTNHLDRRNREALIEQLRHWPRGLLVVSHDRQLLDTLARIVELSSLGLRGYGGNYSAYAASKAQERANALERLEHRKLERRREAQAMQAQRERQERRQARGQRHGKQAHPDRPLLYQPKARTRDSACTHHAPAAHAPQHRAPARPRPQAPRT
ncbi:ABC-F family ATP-binding cassette domain-containing protein, partial [Achromobacter ruhlandii]|nr:ABC-F family ATP-binding cassette domain-containing protein [Achromobacter ruhlandii]